MSRKKLMVLGAGVFQLPLIEAASRLGFHTIALSYYPDDPGREIADEFIVCSTIDKEAVLEHARARAIDGVTTMASEVAAVTAAYVSEKLGLPGYTYETARSIGNKVLLREFLDEHYFKTPGFFQASSLEEAEAAFDELDKPVFMKPAAASGSRGAFKLYTIEELRSHFDESLEASILEKEVILEEFLEGREVGGEVLVKNGCIVFFQPTRKLLNSRFVPYSHILPAGLSNKAHAALKGLMQRTVSALGLRDGPLNFDVMLTAAGPVIIELGGRLGGNCLPELMRLHTGVNTVEAVVRLATGDSFEIPAPEANPVGVFIFGAKGSGRIARIHRLEEKFPQWADDLVRTHISAKVGQCVEPFTQGNHQLGYFVLKAPDAQTIEDRVAILQREAWVDLE